MVCGPLGVLHVISSWRCLGNRQDKLATSGPSASSMTCVWSVYSPLGVSLGKLGCGSSGPCLLPRLLLPRWSSRDSFSICHRYWMTRMCVGGFGQVTTRAPPESNPSSVPCPCGWMTAGTKFSSTWPTSHGGRMAPIT